MTGTIAGITEPVQLHAEGAQIADGRGIQLMATQQADGGHAETGAGSRQGMQMIGVGATQADHARRSEAPGLGQMRCQLVPLVATDQRIDPLQTQQRQLHAGALQPATAHRLQHRRGRPIHRQCH
ncbi:hypothetical protein D9M71_664840 [compost metagenome]